MEIKIKKLKVQPSFGNVFRHLYKKGNPSEIPALKKRIKEELKDFSSQAVLYYREMSDSFAFLGKAEFPTKNDVFAAAGEDVLGKLPRIAKSLAERSCEGELEVIHLPPSEIASAFDVDASSFSVAGIIKPARKR